MDSIADFVDKQKPAIVLYSSILPGRGVVMNTDEFIRRVQHLIHSLDIDSYKTIMIVLHEDGYFEARGVAETLEEMDAKLEIGNPS